MNTLCTLRVKEAVELIKSRPQVYYRRGVWNPYQLRETSAVISSITNSGYGADVYEKDDKLYVSVPVDSDMW